jgi:hypothetical protein
MSCVGDSPGSGTRRCSATRANGEACRAWAVRGSEPALCAAHSGKVGAPPGNRNAEKHGYYSRPTRKIESLDDVIQDLQAKIGRLSDLIDQTDDVAQVQSLVALYAQMTSRLGRLLRDQRALSGKSADDLLDALAKALEAVRTELGVDLEV